MKRKKYDISDEAFTIYTNEKSKCECGHTQFLEGKDRDICKWCGKWIYKNNKTKFKYKIKEINNG